MSEAVYLQIAAELRHRIGRGELAAGQLVPSTRQIARDWGVAIATATKALAELQRDGAVHAVPGVGNVVGGSTPTVAVRPVAPRTAVELTAAGIVRCAVELADAEGLDAVSMRRVAAGLGVATMSLYRYVPNKEELVALMADAVLAEQAPPAPSAGDWRATVEDIARRFWLLCREHHWLAHVISLTRPQLLPHGMAYTDALMGALRRLGFDPATALRAAVTVFAYVRGLALNLHGQEQDVQDSGVTDEQWVQAQDARFTAIARRRFPDLASVQGQPVDMDLDALFEFGLARMLDGYASLGAS